MPVKAEPCRIGKASVKGIVRRRSGRLVLMPLPHTDILYSLNEKRQNPPLKKFSTCTEKNSGLVLKKFQDLY